MATQKIEMTVEPRTAGKHFSRSGRVASKTPAVVYGAIENKNVYIPEGFVVKHNTRKFENTLFTIKADDKALNNVVVLMKSVQVHPVTRKPLHVDLFALDLTKTVRVNLELVFEGKPIGLADGGLLNIVNRQIEIECIPTEIPAPIVIDVSALGLGEAIHVSDVKIPANIKVITSLDTTLAVVNVAEEETAAPTPAAAPAAAAPAAAKAPEKK